MAGVSDVPHPYSIEVSPLSKPKGQFQWAIRGSGALIEQSDRPYSSETKANESAIKAVERMVKPGADGGHR